MRKMPLWKLVLGAVAVLCLVAGVAVTVADNFNAIDHDLWVKVMVGLIAVVLVGLAVAVIDKIREQGGWWAPGERPEQRGFPVTPKKEPRHDSRA